LRSYGKYLDHIDNALKSETPLAFGLHPNAEIGFRTDTARALFDTIQNLQPDGGGGGEGAQTMQHVAAGLMQDLLEECVGVLWALLCWMDGWMCGDMCCCHLLCAGFIALRRHHRLILCRYREKRFDMDNIRGLIDDPGPFQIVYLQECEAMNALVGEMARSLGELELGVAGELTMSPRMEELMASLYLDKVPTSWKKLAYASQRPLGGWLQDLQARFDMLSEWSDSPMEMPRVVWLGGFFNPQSFLTAIMQAAAQRDGHELDKLVITTDVTKRRADEVEHPSRDGAFVVGLYLEGARWDLGGGVINTSLPKEMFSPMPVSGPCLFASVVVLQFGVSRLPFCLSAADMFVVSSLLWGVVQVVNCRASLPQKTRGGQMVAQIPVYKTQQRGPTYVFTAQLRSKASPRQWIMAGVVLVMEVL